MIEYYNSLDECPLYNWDRYLATNCDNWFIKGFDGRQKVIENAELTDLAVRLQDDYFKAINDASFVMKLRKWATIEALNTKYNALISIINRIKLGFTIEQQEVRAKYIDALSKAGFKMPIMNNYEGDLIELEKIYNKVQAIKSQITLIQNELKEEGHQEKQSLQKQLLIISQGLQLGYRLNPKEINVIEWIEMTKLLNEKSKNN